MATSTNSRNLLLSTAASRTVTNQKTVVLSAPVTVFLYTSAGALSDSTATIAITATRQNTTEPIVWTNSGGITLYTAATGGTAVLTPDTTPGTTVTAYVRASDFNTLNLNSLLVTATITDVDVFSSSLAITKLQPGSAGVAGDTAVFAYRVISGASLPAAPSITQGTVPTAGAAVTGTTWYLQPKATLAAEEWMFQVSGTRTAAGVYTWQTQGYLSTFKVGKLEALTTDTGNLTVSATGSIKTAASVYGQAGAFFMGNDGGTTKFSVGNKLLYNGSVLSVPALVLNANGTLSDDVGSRGQVTIRGVGYTGDLNAAAGTRLVVTGTDLILQGNSCSRTSGTSAWNSQCYSVDGFTGGAACSFSAATASGQAVVGLSVNPTANASYESVTYAIFLDGASNEVSIREFGSLPAGFTNIAGAINTTDVFSVVYDGQFIRYAKNGTVFRTAPAPAGLTLYFDSSVYTVGGGLTNIQLSAYTNTNTSRGTSLVDPSWWKTGETLAIWNPIIDAGGTNAFVAATLPDNSTGTVWQATSGTTNATDPGGGWNPSTAATNYFAVNSSKTYMFAVYTKSVSGTAGQEFWGIDSNAVCNLNTTTANTNPYFAYTNKVNGEWHLLVGYVYPAGTTGQSSASAGAYRCTDGVKINTAGTFSANYTWKAATTTASTRSFQYYQNPGAVQQFAWPQVYLCDGTEPSIDDLLSMSVKPNIVLAQTTANAKLSKSSADILTGPITLSTNGGIVAGTLTWDNTGTRTGGQGVAVTPKGIVGHNGVKTTFAVDATTGDATFAGSLSAATGSFAGSLSAATGSFAGSLSAATGTLGTLTINSGGNIKSGQTAYNTGTGFYLGTDSGTPKFSIGNSAGANLQWTGTELLINTPTFESFTTSIASGNIVTSVSFGNQLYGSRTISATGGKPPYSYAWFLTGASYAYVANATSPTVTVYGFGDGNTATGIVVGLVRDSNGRITFSSFSFSATHSASTSGA
jgi:hypothetical protein